MKLYFAKGACSLVVRITIHEIGLACEFEAVDLKTKKLGNGDDFLAINSKGAVPTLMTDENQVLTENAVILQYLADKNNATALLPVVGDFKRYRVLEDLNYITTELHKSFSILFNAQIPLELKNKLFIPLIDKKFAHLAQAIKKGPYLFGDTVMLPDAYLYVMCRWAQGFNIVLESMPEIKRFIDVMQQRKAVRKALEEEGLDNI